MLFKPHICWIFLSWQCCFFPLSAPYIWTRDTYNTTFLFFWFSLVVCFFFSPRFLKDLFGSLETSQSRLCRLYGRWKVSLSLSKRVCNFLDSGKTDFLISIVFCFSFFIHLVSKATGSYFFLFSIFLFSFTLLGVRKAQVNGQTWVSIKRDFLISEIMYSMFRI